MNELIPLTSLAPWAHSQTEFARSLPEMLLYLFERRHLGASTPSRWTPIESDHSYPLLARIQSLGGRTDGRGWHQEFRSVFRSIHEPGHAFHLVLHGNGIEHKMYLGARRLGGFGARNTMDFVGGLQGACKAHITGLEFGSVAKINEDEHSELWEFLQTAPCLAAITGVPGTPDKDRVVGFERLAQALGKNNYAIVIAANPIHPSAVDYILDICRTTKSEIQSYIRRTIQIGESKTSSSTTSVIHSDKDWTQSLPFVLNGLAAFSTLAGFGAGAAAFQSAGMMSWMYQGRKMSQNQEQRSESFGESKTQGFDIFDAHAQACSEILDVFIDRFSRSRGQGLWNTAIYLFAEDESTLARLGGAYRALTTSCNSTIEPLRILRLGQPEIRDAIERGSIIQMEVADGTVRHPFGPAFEGIGTPLTSEELVSMTSLPAADMPGLVVRESVPFSMAIPFNRVNDIDIGRLLDSQNRDLSPIGLPSAALNRHVFVTGMPGYGKTNTCMQILHQAWVQLGIPFLVVEPAKTEYRDMAKWPALRKDVRVYSFGNNSNPLRLNPLMPVNGIPMGRHIDMLKAVFFAAFPMQAGMPYVLEEALLNVYRERGWRIEDSQNRFTPAFGTSPEARSALMPTLKDLHDQIEVVLEKKKYAQEIHQNMGAALRSRINSLMVGTKGLTLNCRLSTSPQDLFTRPCIIELSGLADDDEKCFVMALLLVLLYQEAELRTKYREVGPTNPKLLHLTLIEEAHRLLSSNRRAAHADGADPRGKAMSMFADLLAELRALGEGFIVADQIPTDLIPQVVKNTSVKIVHRLSFPDDRQLVGECMGLNSFQTRQLNQLEPGQAIIHDEGLSGPVLVKIHSVDSLTKSVVDACDFSSGACEKSHLYRHSGCKFCSDPCRYYLELPEDGLALEVFEKLKPLFNGLVLGDRDMSHKATIHFKAWWQDRAAAWLSNSLETGVMFCAASDAAVKWLDNWYKGRLQAEIVISPQSRIESEKALTIMAGWLSEVLISTDNIDIDTTFHETSSSLRTMIATKPPQELSGCSSCSSRCTMLPFVAPIIRQQKLQSSKTTATSKIPISPDVLLKTKLVPAFHQSPSAILGDNYQTAWLHCAVTNWEGLSVESRDKLILKLNDERNSLTDLFGSGKDE